MCKVFFLEKSEEKNEAATKVEAWLHQLLLMKVYSSVKLIAGALTA